MAHLISVVQSIDPQLIASILVALTGLLGAPIINVIKQALGIDGKWAVGLATLISLILAAVVTAVNGAFSGFDLSLPAVIQNMTVIFSMATLFYKIVMGEPVESDPELFDPTDEG